MDKSIFKIKKSIKRDARNWWEANNRISYGHDFSKNCPVEIKKRVKGKKWEDVKQYLIKKITKKYFSQKEFNFLKKKFLPYLVSKEKKIIRILNNIHGRKFPVSFVNIYYTSIKRCPYGMEKEGFWIQLNGGGRDKDLMSSIIIHELMHLYFNRYYRHFCLENGLNREQTEDIKEAFTVVMNEEFKDLFNQKDKGYDIHKKLRTYILKQWKKSKDFKKTLISAIKFVKQNK